MFVFLERVITKFGFISNRVESENDKIKLILKMKKKILLKKFVKKLFKIILYHIKKKSLKKF